MDYYRVSVVYQQIYSNLQTSQCPYQSFHSHRQSCHVHFIKTMPKMRQLLSLPIEIVLQILEEVGPEDIEQVALSCKTAYVLVKKALREHVQRKSKYSRVVFGGLFTRNPSVQPASLLRDVLFNEKLVFYPQDIIIGRLSERAWNPAPDLHHEGIFGDVHNILSRKTHECSYLNDYDAQSLRKVIAQGKTDAMVAFLITLLPNLRSMHVYPSYYSGRGSSRCVLEAVFIIAKAYSATELPLSTPALSKLSVVELYGADFGDLLSFAALPSMRSMIGKRLTCNRSDGTFDIHFSGLHTIKLFRCIVNYNDLVKLLRGIKALEVFIYYNENHNFHPRRILAALSEHAAHSLTQLAVTSHSKPANANNLANYYFAALWRFRSLKDCFLDAKIFFRPIDCIVDLIEGGLDLNVCTEPRLKNYKVARLMDMLPKSIESCHLLGDTCESNQDAVLVALMAGLPELKSIRLPNLCEIVYVDGNTSRPEATLYEDFSHDSQMRLFSRESHPRDRY